ncbi:MAG: hypothetical protein AVDCRST_MAG93-3398, partial [uncultured Chloroflexia bacterium]
EILLRCKEGHDHRRAGDRGGGHEQVRLGEKLALV